MSALEPRGVTRIFLVHTAARLFILLQRLAGLKHVEARVGMRGSLLQNLLLEETEAHHGVRYNARFLARRTFSKLSTHDAVELRALG